MILSSTNFHKGLITTKQKFSVTVKTLRYNSGEPPCLWPWLSFTTAHQISQTTPYHFEGDWLGNRLCRASKANRSLCFYEKGVNRLTPEAPLIIGPLSARDVPVRFSSENGLNINGGHGDHVFLSFPPRHRLTHDTKHCCLSLDFYLQTASPVMCIIKPSRINSLLFCRKAEIGLQSRC